MTCWPRRASSVLDNSLARPRARDFDVPHSRSLSKVLTPNYKVWNDYKKSDFLCVCVKGCAQNYICKPWTAFDISVRCMNDSNWIHCFDWHGSTLIISSDLLCFSILKATCTSILNFWTQHVLWLTLLLLGARSMRPIFSFQRLLQFFFFFFVIFLIWIAN